MTDLSNSEFDLVLWGATGFTGRLVARYLADQATPDSKRWAIAGRNRDKLEGLRDELGADPDAVPILIGDCFDRESLDAITARTRVICTTVGPYSRYGSELVASCVAASTDYCDLTGEIHWIREMIDVHHREAQQADVRIVHCCGFDAIPSDLGTYLVQSEAQKRFGKPCDEVRFLVRTLRGGVSGGTAQSAALVIEDAVSEPRVRRIVGHPYGLNPSGERSGPDTSVQRGPRRDSTSGSWTGPFIMAAINEKIVRRTNALLDFEYGRQFRYSEASDFGTGPAAALRAAASSAGLGVFTTAMAVKPTRKLLQRWVLPSPGEGPDEQTIEEGAFSVVLTGRGIDESGDPFELKATVSADLDPGYGATAIMLAESALCLADDELTGGLPGGVLTPAAAMGSDLIARLQRAGMTFEITSARR